jgi:hypothetical protein
MLPAPLAESARRLGAVVVPFRRRVRRPVLLIHRRSTLSPAAGAFLRVADVAPRTA